MPYTYQQPQTPAPDKPLNTFATPIRYAEISCGICDLRPTTSYTSVLAHGLAAR
jgi:hypothetical protein